MPRRRFFPAAEIRDLLARIGLPQDALRALGVYCGSGVAAAYGVAALQTVGVEASLYPGSWTEWVKDPQRPVEQGAEADA